MGELSEKLYQIRLGRRQFIRLLWQGSVLAALPTLYAGESLLKNAVVCEVPFAMPGAPAAWHGLKVVQLSDIHMDAIASVHYLRRVVAQVNALQPDLVMLTGDFVTFHAKFSAVVGRELGALRSRYGTYAVLGNHDIWTDPERIQHNLAAAGITVLRNTAYACSIDGVPLWLIGIEDAGESLCDDFATFQRIWAAPRTHLERALANIPAGALCLLLVHNPDFAEMLPPRRIALTLAGHTHGGTIYMPQWGWSLASTCFGTRYLAGLVHNDATSVYINRGLGGFKVRINATPEITLLRLQTTGAVTTALPAA